MIGKRLAAAFAVAIILLIVNAAVSFQATEKLVENNSKVVHTMQVIETIGSAIYHLTEAESAQRGYIVSGEQRFIESFDSARKQRSEQNARLVELTSDNPTQAQRAAALEQVSLQRLDTLSRVIEIRSVGDVETVMRSGLFGRGQLQMAEVRRLAAEINSEEERLLSIRTEESRQSAQNAVLTFVAANALVLGLLGLVYYLFIRDLAERKRAAELLQQAHDKLEERVKERTLELADLNTELERSNRELQDFAYVASHDLQEPLRKIQAFSDRLKTKHAASLPEEAGDYIERMKQAAARMHTLINDLLTFSRVTTKAQPFEPTDLNEIVNDVVGDLEISLQESGGRVEFGELPTLDADPVQMRQLFQNLIGNALKFHKPGQAPAVEISFSRSSQGKNVRELGIVRVKDNGIGFDEKYLDRIFTPFQRLHGRNSYAGTGIGLAVCRKIVERHGGSITAESRPEAGATFIVTLPLKQGPDTNGDVE